MSYDKIAARLDPQEAARAFLQVGDLKYWRGRFWVPFRDARRLGEAQAPAYSPVTKGDVYDRPVPFVLGVIEWEAFKAGVRPGREDEAFLAEIRFSEATFRAVKRLARVPDEEELPLAPEQPAEANDGEPDDGSSAGPDVQADLKVRLDRSGPGGARRLEAAVEGLTWDDQEALAAVDAAGERQLREHRERLEARRERLKDDPAAKAELARLLREELEDVAEGLEEVGDHLAVSVAVLAARAYLKRQLQEQIEKDLAELESEDARQEGEDATRVEPIPA